MLDINITSRESLPPQYRNVEIIENIWIISFLFTSNQYTIEQLSFDTEMFFILTRTSHYQ